MNKENNTDVYESLKKQKRKSIIFTFSLALMLVVMAIIGVYFIVFDNIDSFLSTVQGDGINYETVSDNKGFTYKIQGIDAILTDYTGDDTVVKIPDTVNGIDVTSIESFNNENVVEITVPDSVQYIEYKAFYHHDKLKIVKGCKYVSSVEEAAFKGCTALEEFPFNNNIIGIGKEAFCNTNLKKVELPFNMTGLNKRVFNSCRNLEEFTIGPGLCSIDDQCFKNCDKLAKVICYGGTMGFEDEVFENCSKDLVVYCSPDSDMSYYCNDMGIKTAEIPE